MSLPINSIFAPQNQHSINYIYQKCESVMFYNNERICGKYYQKEIEINNEIE